MKLASLSVVVLAAGCASAGGTSPRATAPPPAASTDAVAAARADSARFAYTDADVAFMTGMIHHHVQALIMAREAPSHGASERVQVLTSRILNSQLDEIHWMQAWLADRGLPVPEPDGLDPSKPGKEPLMMMPGMLSADQMAELDAARGEDWDFLFLRYMIQHHRGALDMVDHLFASNGSGQGQAIFKLASDIVSDQQSDIDRMQQLLRRMAFGSNAP